MSEEEEEKPPVDRNDFRSGMEEDLESKPPLLTKEEASSVGSRKQHQGEEEEDFFEEIEDEEDEEEIVRVVERNPEYQTQNHEEPSDSYENPRQEPEIIHEYEEAPLIESGVRCQLPKSRHMKYAFDHSKYIIDYRPSQHKSKTKNSHNVAIVAKVDANICHEFSYNRTSDFDGSKFYTCLGCRKAKFESRVKDVVRTIRIDERYRAILSKGDPFEGHHYACTVLPWAPDTRSYGHVLPQPMHMDLGEYAPSELVYMDADGSEAIWDNGEGASYLANIPFYGETGPPPDSKMFNSNDMRPSTSSSSPPPVLQPEIPPEVPRPKSHFRRFKDRQKYVNRSAPKCHLCFRVLRSTEGLIAHLQMHLKRTPAGYRSMGFQQLGKDLRRCGLQRK